MVKLVLALTFTVICWKKFQIWTYFLNCSAGHLKPCGGPHLARGLLFAHPCSSSVGWRIVARDGICPRLPFIVEFLPIFIFSAVILAPDMLASQSKNVSKYLDDSLDSKKNWAKKWPVGLAPRARQTQPQGQKHVPIMISPKENPTPKTKNIFLKFELEDLLNL